MTLTLLAVGFLLMLAAAYRIYGGWVARQFRLDDARETPAHRVNDGVDFVPTKPFYLSVTLLSYRCCRSDSRSNPGLSGVRVAACLLWIGLGVVLIGAVHDFASLAASVRHGATSIAEIAREHLGTGAGRAMMAFI